MIFYFFVYLQINTQRIEIMGAGVIAGAGVIYGITSLVKTLINKLVPDNDGSDIGQETLNNSTIEHEEKSHRSATFLFDFENGSSQLIIIIIGGILALVIAVGCCMLLCRYCQFSSLYCCKKSNSKRGIDFYREHFYVHIQPSAGARRGVAVGNTPAQIMEMRSIRDLPSIPHDTRFQTNNKFNYEKNEDNSTKEQNVKKME